MLNKTGAGCLAIAKSIGVGLPVAVHAHHSSQGSHSVPLQAQTVVHACYTERAGVAGNGLVSSRSMPCGTIEHLLQANVSLTGDRFIDNAHAVSSVMKITLSLHGARPATG
jgi:imidazolonepropionase-like amidohydrolase